MPVPFPPIFDGHDDALLRMRMDGISFLDRNDGPDSGCVFDLPLDRIVELAGIDRAGFGSDYDYIAAPRDLATAADMPNLVTALEERGYHGQDLEKILYRNWVRVLRETWGE